MINDVTGIKNPYELAIFVPKPASQLSCANHVPSVLQDKLIIASKTLPPYENFDG